MNHPLRVRVKTLYLQGNSGCWDSVLFRCVIFLCGEKFFLFLIIFHLWKIFFFSYNIFHYHFLPTFPHTFCFSFENNRRYLKNNNKVKQKQIGIGQNQTRKKSQGKCTRNTYRFRDKLATQESHRNTKLEAIIYN